MRAETEGQFLGWVVDVARRNGWAVAHVSFPARVTRERKLVPDKMARGILDLQLTCTAPPRLILAELKKVGGEYTTDQVETIKVLSLVVDAQDALVDDAAKYVAEYEPDEPAPERFFAVYGWDPNDRPTIEHILKTKELV